MNKLYVYIEGSHDEIFINSVLVDYVRINMDINLHPIPYAKKPYKKISDDIKSKWRYKYLFLSDLDSKLYPCITSRKQKRFEEYEALDCDNIIIVKEEIESWFLAGVDNSLDKFKDWKIPPRTDGIEKDEFDAIYKQSFDVKTDCLKEIANNYNFDLAVERNKSLKYFLNKLSNMFN